MKQMTRTNLPSLTGSGTIVLPIEFNLLHQQHTPSKIIELFVHIEKHILRVERSLIDVVFLYNDGLHSHIGRKHLQNALLGHRNGIENAIRTKTPWPSHAFHFLTWNQSLLLSDSFGKRTVYLEKILRRHEAFRKSVAADLKRMDLPDSDPHPVLEILALQSGIRDCQIQLPKALAPKSEWNLLATQTSALNSEMWLLQNRVFPTQEANIFGSHTYLAGEDKIIA